jgi:hypothetical protein
LGDPQRHLFGTLAQFVQGAVNEMLDEVLAEPLSDAIRGYDLDRGGFHGSAFSHDQQTLEVQEITKHKHRKSNFTISSKQSCDEPPRICARKEQPVLSKPIN